MSFASGKHLTPAVKSARGVRGNEQTLTTPSGRQRAGEILASLRRASHISPQTLLSEGDMKHTDRFVVVVILFAALASAAILERHMYAAAPTGHFKVFRVPTAGIQPRHITAGPDGNMWFTESNANANVAKIGRIDAAGNVTE